MPKTTSAFPDNFQVAQKRTFGETKIFHRRTDEMLVYEALRKNEWAYLLKDLYLQETGEIKNKKHLEENTTGFRAWLKNKFPHIKLDI